MRRTPMLALTLLAALALLGAGCGGGKKSAATTEAVTTETTTTEAATTEAATTTEETTTEETTTEAATTEAATTTSPIGNLVAGGKCKEFANLSQKYANAFSGTGGGQDLKKTAQVVQDFAKKAPSDIRADFQVVADYLSKIADVVGNFKPGQTPDAATIQKLQKLSTEVDQAKLTAASQHITAWVQKNCSKG